MIPIHLKTLPIDPKDPFNIKKAVALDSKVSAAFQTMVDFRGDRNAVFLIITDGPEMQDCEHVPPILDCKDKIGNAFDRVISNFYLETFITGNVPKRRDPATYSTAIISLCLGHHGSPFRRTPTSVEIGASAPHIRELILGMPNLRLVYVLGKYAEEFFVHNLDAHVMYGIAPEMPFHIHQTVSPTMISRQSCGKYGNAYIGGKASFRYYSLPWVGHRDFDITLVRSLFRIEDSKYPLIKYPVSSEPYDISQPPLSVNHGNNTSEYFDFQSFKRHIHANLRVSELKSLSTAIAQIRDDLEDDFTPMTNFSDDSFDGYVDQFVDEGDDDGDDVNFNKKTNVAAVNGDSNNNKDEDDEGEPYTTATSYLNDDDDDCAMSSPPKARLSESSFLSCLDDCPEDSHAEAPRDVIRPTDILFNAATDPYRKYPPTKPMYACIRNIQYDSINNRMNLYCSTPSSNAILVSVNNPVFSIYLAPHFAFGGPQGNWERNSHLLKDSQLSFLRSYVSKRLYHKKQERNFALPGKGSDPVSFELVSGKHDESDGYWHEREFKFIRVDVAHHAFIESVLGSVKKLITEDERHKKDPFKLFGLYQAEKMFIYKYRVYMSTWHRITNLTITPALAVAPEDGVSHSRLLNAHMDFAKPGTKLEFLKPSDIVPLYDEGDEDDEVPRLTSSDMPVDIRSAFDIETWFERGVKDFDNTPVICICMSVRRHDNKITQFDNKPGPDGSPPTFTPKNGYNYYTFMMGKTAPPDKKTSELLGPEFLFEFYREDHLLSSFFYFKHLLMASYIQGHNSKGFDEVKLFARARMIGAEIAPQGWRLDQQTRLTVKKFKSIAKGERRQYFAEGQEGTCHVDTLQVAMNELNRNSYQLSSLSADLVGMTKHDMPYDAIKGHWSEGPEARRTLVDYCIRDAQLPDQINTKRQTIATMCELSRVVTNVCEDRLHDEGMQIKVLGAIMYTNAEDGNQALLPTSQGWMKTHNQEINDSICSSNKNQIDALVRKLYFGEDEAVVGANEDDAIVGYRPKEPDPNHTKQKPPDPLSSSGHASKLPADADDSAMLLLCDVAETKSEFSNRPRTFETEVWNVSGGALLYTPEKSYFNPLKDGECAKLPKKDKRTFAQKRAAAESQFAKSQSENGNGLRRKAEYAGATVMTAHKGWYRDVPLVGVDFAALYPTIIIANNIARNTQVYEDEMVMRGVTEDMCLPSPPDLLVTNPRTGKKGRVFFVKKEYRVGLMVSTEVKLLASRNVAKSLIPVFGKEFEKDGVTRNPKFNENLAEIVNQRSNGLKLVANSGYGVFGTNTENGNMHCAASVTAFGRYYIGLCKTEVERLWGGYVAGGDTDSIFVGFAGDKDGNFRYETTTEAEEFAEKVVIPTLNKLFPAPVKLDFEKTMVYFVAVAKKRYIYWLCNKGQKPYLNFKGLEIVRRDSLPFTKKTMLNCLDILQEWPKEHLTREQDKEWVRVRKERAVQHIKERARILLSGELSIGDLKLSKSISREYYDNRNQEHLSVVDKLLKRDLPTPGIGDRVYFVYTKMPTPENHRGEMKGYMIADDPEHVIRNDTPIDYKYYFEHKYMQPITSIMTHFLMDDMTELFFKRHPHKQQVTMKELAAQTRNFLFDNVFRSKRTRLDAASSTSLHPEIVSFAAPIVLDDVFAEEHAKHAARQAVAAAKIDVKVKTKELSKLATVVRKATEKATKAAEALKKAVSAKAVMAKTLASKNAAKEARAAVAAHEAMAAALAAALAIATPPPRKRPTQEDVSSFLMSNPTTASSSSSSTTTAHPKESSSSSLGSEASPFAALATMQLHRKIIKPRADVANNKSIAFYSQASKLVRQTDEIIGDDGQAEERRRPREHIQLEYTEKIVATKASLAEKTEKRDEIHKGCRACLKIGPDKKVVCKAVTCKIYDTRIEAECRVDNTSALVDRLTRELQEALGDISDCPSNKMQRRR